MRSSVNTKACRTLIALIEGEGATILDTTNNKNHMRVVYTFNGHDTFTQTLPRHQFTGGRWEKNFRAAIRRTKPQGTKL